MFTKIILDYKNNLFAELMESVEFENITNGRKSAVLVNMCNNLIPIVRTTTKYQKPVQEFKQIHYDVIKNIKENINNIQFNNALIELYDNRYCSMGFHSDQALDLADDSYIAVYSCYENNDENNFRKLIVKNKVNGDMSQIVMNHNSVILFDLNTNQQYLHKIILENNKINNKWIGITFRMSKTFINYCDGIPFFDNSDNILRLANDEEIKNFYKMRSQENREVNYKYPNLNYTISPSDLYSIGLV